MKKISSLILIIFLCSIHPTFIQAQVPGYVQSSGLVAWYSFNGNAFDESGNGSNGIINGSLLTTDRHGNINSAYAYNGISDWIDYGDQSILNPGINDITVSAWIKTTDTYGRIYSKGTHGGTQAGYCLMIYPGAGGRAALVFGNNTGSENIILSNVPVNDNVWHLITGVFDRDGFVKLYVDGVLQSDQENISAYVSENIGFNTFNASTGASYSNLGAAGPPTEFFNGIIDEVGVWMSALNECDIIQLYIEGFDTIPPTITCPPSLAVGSEPSNCWVIANSVTLTPPVTSDNCGVATVVNSFNDLQHAGVIDVGVHSITWTVTDIHGNTSSCVQEFTVVDNQGPILTCPTTQNLDLSSSCDAVLPDYTQMSTATDNCGTAIISQSPIPGTIVNGSGPMTVTLTATDDLSNISTCSFTVNKLNMMSPIIVGNDPGNCSANINIPFEFNLNDCIMRGNALNFDGDNDAMIIPSGNFSAYTIETWVKFDSSTASQTIMVFTDGNPSNFSHILYTDANGRFGHFAYDGTYNGCLGTTIAVPGVWYHVAGTATSGADMKLYVNGVLEGVPNPINTLWGGGNQFWVGSEVGGGSTDLNGTLDELRIWNVERLSMEIQANMNTTVSPQPGLVANYRFDQGIANANNSGLTTVINDQGNAALNGSIINLGLNGLSSNWVNGILPATGLTITNSVNGTNDASGNYPVGTTPITWTVSDASSNTVTFIQNIVVEDIEAPGIVCPPDLVVSNDLGQCWVSAYSVSIGTAVVSPDNCGIVTVTNSFNDLQHSGVIDVGVHSIIWTATDVNGNSSTCTQAFTVVDDQAPVIYCPGNILVSNDAGVCGANVNYVVSSSDNCSSSVTQTAGLPSGSVFPVGITTNIFIASDAHGNTSTCSFTVTVNDITPPVTPTIADATGECSVTVTAPTTTDNCVGMLTGTTTDPFTYNTLGNFVITWTFDDGNGNTTTATQNVIVDDITPPITPTLADATGECTVTVTAPTTTDNCAASINGTTTDPLTYNIQGTFVITWTFDDGNGNTTTATQSVIVDDITPPITPTLVDATGECSITVTAPTTTDVCVGIISGTTTDPLTYNTQGIFVITWSFDDGNGNTTTANQNVIVNDVTAPTTPTLADVTGECSVTPTVPTASDNCVGTITGTSTTTFPITSQGTTVVTWTFDDGNGNVTQVDQNVIVNDVTAPVADVFSLPILTGCNVNVSTVPTATDNCNGAITGTTTDPLTYSVVGGYSITWTYDDGNGNTSTQTQTVTIIDCSGIEEVEALEMNVFPNPSNGIFNLSFVELPEGKTTIKIMDAVGKVIYANEVMNQATHYNFSYLKAGTYYLQIINGNKSITKTIIVTQQY